MSATNESEDLVRARSNVLACAYNVLVNADSPRLHKKLPDLGDAINRHLRLEGRVTLQALVDAGVIDGFTPCPDECVVRPGGLSHAKGCENDGNHDVYRARQARAREVLPGGVDGHDGWRAASVSLVGDERSITDYYREDQVRGIAAMLRRPGA